MTKKVTKKVAKKVSKKAKAKVAKKEEIAIPAGAGFLPIGKFIFSWFASEWQKSQTLPKKEDVGTVMAEHYPNSVFAEKLTIHYSYYKSKFLSALQVAAVANKK